MAGVTIHQHDINITVDVITSRPVGSWFCLRLGDDINIYLDGYDAQAIANARSIAQALTDAADALERTLDAKCQTVPA